MRPQWPHFRVVGLIEAITAIAVALAFWTWYLPWPRCLPVFYWILVLVTAIAMFVFACAWAGVSVRTHPRLARWNRSLVALNLLLAAWFITVEWYWYIRTCPTCVRRDFIHEYQFCGFMIRREYGKSYGTLIETIAAEVGVPCRHEKAERVVHQRWSGLCLLLEHGGTYLWDPPVYPPCARGAVQSWVKEDPSFAATFRRRVLEQRDWDYWKSLLNRMYRACPAEELPKYLRNTD